MPRYLVGIAAAVGAYALWPLDLIPDFIPLLGYADDAALVPLGIVLAAKLHKARAGKSRTPRPAPAR